MQLVIYSLAFRTSSTSSAKTARINTFASFANLIVGTLSVNRTSFTTNTVDTGQVVWALVGAAANS